MKEFLFAMLLDGQVGIASISDTDIKIELYAMNCQKVTEFTVVSVVIPEDHYMVYQEMNQTIGVWQLDGIKEIRVTVSENRWIFVRGKDGKFREAEHVGCGMTI